MMKASPRTDRPKRRTVTAGYKVKIWAEYDAAVPGERGALLRGKGCAPSIWWSSAGGLNGLAAKPSAAG